MSVFACRELADDFMRSPLAPVVTMGGMTSVNHDNYADTDVGLEQLNGLAAGEYPNVPPRAFFNTIRTVTNRDEFLTEYNAAQPGDAIVVTDGVQTWGANSNCNRSFTIDDPLYILADTHLGVSFADETNFGFTVSGVGHVFAGFLVESVTSSNSGKSNIFEAFVDPVAYMRVTSCSFPATKNHTPIGVYGACYQMVGFEVDNCFFDSANSTTNSKTHITINTRTPITSSGNPRYIRLHHNIHKNIPSGGTEKNPIKMGLGWQAIDPADAANPYNSHLYSIIENCTIDNCIDENEQIELKTSSCIFRHNLVIKGHPNSGLNFRGSDGSIAYGNWVEDMAQHAWRTAGRDTVVAFNYFGSGGGGDVFAIHGFETDGLLYGYIPADRAQFVHNVATRYSYVLRNNPDGRQSNPVDIVLDGNHFYCSTMPQTDVSGAGNYLDDQGSMNETLFRSLSTWGANTYSTTDLAVTFAKTSIPSLTPGNVSGPGTVFTVPDPTAVFGQPAEIHAPSWWA